jgi:7-cyano-7-deazaguanine synthase
MIGVNEVDYSGYPDCRGPFVQAMSQAIALGFETPVALEAPLLGLDKKKIVLIAYETLLSLRSDYGKNIVDDVLGMSHTCYNGQRPACGRCASCLIRQDGFDRAGLPDPAYKAS